MKIKITINNNTFIAKLNDTETAKAIYESLPSESSISTWGDEIYFQIDTAKPISTSSSAVTNLEVGDIAYYPPMKVLCLFFGPTPLSIDGKPKAAGKVNVCGQLIEFEIDGLRNCTDGSIAKVEKLEE